MLKRKIESKLLQWRNNERKVALLVKGPRQVGKTTSIRDFGKKYYKSFIEINFEEHNEYKDIFKGNLDAKSIIERISIYFDNPLIEKETLIFFDEIQFCPNARTAIKFLVEDNRFDYIESSSLLGLNYRDVSSYPVGFEDYLEMYSLDFEEFLWALSFSEDKINYIKSFFDKRIALPIDIHNLMMEYFKKYMIIGGMPAVAAEFTLTNTFNNCFIIQKRIVDNYRNDINKYAGKDKVKVNAIYDSIPIQLMSKNKKFILKEIDNNIKNPKGRTYKDSIEWLYDAGIAYFCFNITALEIPLKWNEKRNIYKFFLRDTGLLAHLSMGEAQKEIYKGNLFVNEGAITENAIAEILYKNGIDVHYYDLKGRLEIDFVIEHNNILTLIEVKSGKDYKIHKSLSMCSENNKVGKSIVFSTNNLEETDKVIYYPLYMAMFIKNKESELF